MGRRVLGAARLSHDTDESTSIERQATSIDYACKARGDVLVHVTEDTDTSGAVPPFDRDGLGPWLREPLVSQWDTLMVAKLDRLTRSLRDFDDFRLWCDKNGKTIVSVSESIDLSTSIGRMFANLLAMFAQFERERMSERRKDAADKAKLDGRYDGRKIPFGYIPNGDKRFVQDEAYAKVAADMAAWRIDGRSYAWIARKLNEGDVPPRAGGQWNDDHVTKILMNPGLNGQTVRRVFPEDGPPKLKVLLGDDGMPLKFTDEPILDDDTWRKLQKVTTTKPRREPRGNFLLTHVVFCGNCAQALYGSSRNKGNDYYRCRSLSSQAKSCRSPLIPLAALESEVEDAVLARWGDRELFVRTVKAGTDYRGEIQTVKDQIAALEGENYTDPHELKASIRRVARLEARLEDLESRPVEDESEDWTPAGVMMRDHYLSLDAEGRNYLLEKWGVRAMARREDGEVKVSVYLGDPEGFEQATGLILRHDRDDHIPMFLIAGVLFRRLEDGTMEVYREPGKAAMAATIRQWLELTQVNPNADDARDQDQPFSQQDFPDLR